MTTKIRLGIELSVMKQSDIADEEVGELWRMHRSCSNCTYPHDECLFIKQLIRKLVEERRLRWEGYIEDVLGSIDPKDWEAK
jgi:hypothetical protein